MNTTHNMFASVSLGLMASMGGVALAEGGGDPRVEIIEQPAASNDIGNFVFSDDGELRLFHVYEHTDSDIYRYETGEWTLIRRELWAVVPGITPIDVSTDGSVLLMTDFGKTEVLSGRATFTMPKQWTYADTIGGHSHQRHVWGSVYAGHVSSDGRVVTLRGVASDDHSPGSDSLVWAGGSDLVNISNGLPRGEGISYGAGVPNVDGSVVAFSQHLADGDSNIWVWASGILTELPRLDPLSGEDRDLRAVSADGERIFGNDESDARGGFWGYWNHLNEAYDGSRPIQHPSTAWVWSQKDGIVPIFDEARFLETSIWDINDEGTMALIEARPIGSNDWERYLWYGEDNFVLIDDLLAPMGLPDYIRGFGFWQISGDGSKLMGATYIDNRIHAVTVEIPVR